MGNDVRNHIYLPDPEQIWVDYLTGELYQGGQVLNNFDVPLWKLPVFVKQGSDSADVRSKQYTGCSEKGT